MRTWNFCQPRQILWFSLRSLQIRVKWACKSGLKGSGDWFWMFKLKKRKRFEDLRSGFVRTWWRRKKKKKNLRRVLNRFFSLKQEWRRNPGQWCLRRWRRWVGGDCSLGGGRHLLGNDNPVLFCVVERKINGFNDFYFIIIGFYI